MRLLLIMFNSSDKIEFDGINEEKPYSVVGRYGVVTKDPDGMFKMPFYFRQTGW